MAVSPDIRKRLLYAKYLLSRAKKDQNDRNELAVAACLLLMHDATPGAPHNAGFVVWADGTLFP